MLDSGEKMSTKTAPWSTYSSGKLYVTLHDGDAFGVYSTEIPGGRNVSGEKGKGEVGESRTRPQRDGRGRPPSLPARPIWQSSASARRLRPSESWCRSSYPGRSREPVCSIRGVSARKGRDRGVPYDARERELSEEEVSAALVLANLAKCERAGTIATLLPLSRLLSGIRLAWGGLDDALWGGVRCSRGSLPREEDATDGPAPVLLRAVEGFERFGGAEDALLLSPSSGWGRFRFCTVCAMMAERDTRVFPH